MAPENERLNLDNRPILEFFKDAVDKATTTLNFDPSLEASFYVVNLLKDFAKSDHVFDKQAEKSTETPLVLLLERAVHGDAETRLKTLKYIGDVSLYFAGFFPQHITARSVDLDYYVAMGGGAYLTLAGSLFKPHTFADIFDELGNGFGKFVELLAEVSAISRQKTNLDILKLYERWLTTGDERLETLLKREGISITTTNRNDQ